MVKDIFTARFAGVCAAHWYDSISMPLLCLDAACLNVLNIIRDMLLQTPES
jgi:hypothetical protein